MKANELAKLLNNLNRIAQEVTLHARQRRRSYKCTGGAGRRRQLPIEPQHLHELEGLAQLAREVGLQHADIAQAHDALVGGRLHQPVLEGKTTNAMHDGKDAAFLQVQCIAIALRRDQAFEQTDRCGEGIDRAREMGQKGLLSADHLNQRGLGFGQQLRVSSDGPCIVEDGDVQMGGVVGQRHPVAEIRKIVGERLGPCRINHHHVPRASRKSKT